MQGLRRRRWAAIFFLHVLLQCGQLSEAKYIGANPDRVNHPKLSCEVEGSNSTPGEELTFRCVVTPTTVIRYCEMRPPWASSPILVEDGSNELIGSDIVDDLIWIEPSSTSTTPSATTSWSPKPRTTRTTTATTSSSPTTSSWNTSSTTPSSSTTSSWSTPSTTTSWSTSSSSTTTSSTTTSSTTTSTTTSSTAATMVFPNSTNTSTPTSSNTTSVSPYPAREGNRTRKSVRGKFYGWSSRLDYVGQGFANGDCSTAIRRVSLEDAGTWRVTVGIEEQMMELAAKMDVVLQEATALPLKTNVEVPEDWAWAILTCHTTDHRPLRFCRFLRPDGTPLISDEVGMGPGLNLEAGVGYGRYQYHGNGMSTGDCGVTLTNVLDSDAGEWLCVVGVSGDAGQQRGELTLRPPPPNLPGGLSLGAMMGIGLVCAFVLFVVVHEIIERRVTWRERRAVRKRSEKASKGTSKDALGSNHNPSIVGKF